VIFVSSHWSTLIRGAYILFGALLQLELLLPQLVQQDCRWGVGHGAGQHEVWLENRFALTCAAVKTVAMVLYILNFICLNLNAACISRK
jgi:hypothetical protein